MNEEEQLFAEGQNLPSSFPEFELDANEMNLMDILSENNLLSSPTLCLGSDLSSPDASPESLFPMLDDTPFYHSLENSQLNTTQMADIQANINQSLPEDVSEEPKKKRGRKRQRKDLNESSDVSAVILTPEQLANYTTEEMDNYIRDIEIQRGMGFTSAERKVIKQQRRRISNRESAQQSREKKKNYVTHLEEEIRQLQADKSALQNEVGNLSKENVSMKNQLQYLHSKVKELSARMFDSSTDEFVEENPQKVIDMGSSFPKVKTQTVQRAKTAGVCLLIVLFSFGLFFNVKESPSQFRFPRTAIPQVIPTASFVSHRQLLEFDSPTASSPSLQRNPPEEPNLPTSVVDDLSYDVMEDLDHWESTASLSSIPSPSPSLHQTEGINFAEFMNESSNTLSQLTIDDEATLSLFQKRLKEHPNTAFFAASDFHQIVIPDSGPFDPSSDFYISILVPTSQLSNKNLASSNNTLDVVEISCQVIDVDQTSVVMNALHHHPVSSH